MKKSTSLVLASLLILVCAHHSQANTSSSAPGGFWAKFKSRLAQIFSSGGSDEGSDDSNSDGDSLSTPVPKTQFIIPAPSPSVNPDFCSVNGIEKFWAQKRLAAGEMLSYIDSHQLRSQDVLTRVYVLDTGFDSSQLKNINRASTFKFESGVFGTQTQKDGKTLAVPGDPQNQDSSQVSLVGDPSNDVGGHGTMVVSTIAAKDGLGVAPHADVSILRITASDDPNQSETTPDGFLRYAIVRACVSGRAENPNGVIIINKSWISRDEELGKTLQSTHPEIVKVLQDNGCLLVEAAGNDAFRSESGNDDLTLPILSVGSTGAFDNFSTFSSSGGVLAPGENVYVIESTKDGHPAYNFQRCNSNEDTQSGSPRRLENGTSFASPFVAGIASEVLGVLETLHPTELNALSPSDRAVLLGRIVKASAEFGIVHGLRAVMIAERWKGGLSSSDELSSLLQSSLPALCNDDKSNTETRFAVCDSMKNFATASGFAIREMSGGYFQSAAGYLRAAEALATPQDDVETPVEDFMNRFLNSKYNTSDSSELMKDPEQSMLRLSLDANMTRFAIIPYIQKVGAQALPVLKALLEGYSAEDYLKRGPGRGSEDIFASLIEAIQDYQKSAGDAATQSLVTDVTNYWLQSLNSESFGLMTNAEKIAAVVRILNGLSGQASLQTALNDASLKVASALDSFPTWFGEQVQENVIVSELYENRPYMYDFFTQFPQIIQSVLQRPDFNKTSIVEIQYLLDKAPPSDPTFYLRAAVAVDQNADWAAATHSYEITTGIEKSLESLFLGWSSDAQKSFLQNYLSLDGLGANAFSMLDTLTAKISQPLLVALKSAGGALPKNLPNLDLVNLIASSDQARLGFPKFGLGRFAFGDLNFYLIDYEDDTRVAGLVHSLNQWLP